VSSIKVGSLKNGSNFERVMRRWRCRSLKSRKKQKKEYFVHKQREKKGNGLYQSVN